MRLDHTSPESVARVKNRVGHELHQLLRSLDRELDVRLVANVDGELWFATGDVSYDTAHGAACEAITLHPVTDHDEIADLAAVLVDGVADQLAELTAEDE